MAHKPSAALVDRWERGLMTKRKLSELQPDKSNANKGTERGRAALEASLRKYGAGRSILIDKSGRIIAGNKTAEVAGAIGLDDVLIVQTDGKRLVAVQRTDLDIDSPAGRELAYADNRVGQLDLDFDVEQMLADINAGVDLTWLWSEIDLARLTGVGEVDDPTGEWVGMPEFVQEDKTSFQAIHVHFKTEADRDNFAAMIGQNLTGSTRSIWYPLSERIDMKSELYGDES